MRALKQELSRATPGSWSSWPGASLSRILATIFVPPPPFWEVLASSAPMSPGPQWRADRKSPATPLLGRPTGSPPGSGSAGPGRRVGAGGGMPLQPCPRPREVLAWFLPCSLLARRHPGTLRLLSPRATARPGRGWKAAPALPTPVLGLGLIQPKAGSQARGAGTAWGSPSSPLVRRVKLPRALHTAGAARMLPRGGACGRRGPAAQKASTRVSRELRASRRPCCWPPLRSVCPLPSPSRQECQPTCFTEAPQESGDSCRWLGAALPSVGMQTPAAPQPRCPLPLPVLVLCAPAPPSPCSPPRPSNLAVWALPFPPPPPVFVAISPPPARPSSAQAVGASAQRAPAPLPCPAPSWVAHPLQPPRRRLPWTLSPALEWTPPWIFCGLWRPHRPQHLPWATRP